MVSAELLALERLCDKRHALMMQKGLSEKESSFQIVLFLDAWIEHQTSGYKIRFGKQLRGAYAS